MHEAEEHLRIIGVEDWVSTQRRRKWRWAQRITTDSSEKWTFRAMMWQPAFDSRFKARRQQARPCKRWTDDISNYLTSLTSTTTTQPTHNNDNNNDDEDRRTPDNADDGDYGVSNNAEAGRLADTAAPMNWMRIAEDRRTWQALEENFVKRP